MKTVYLVQQCKITKYTLIKEFELFFQVKELNEPLVKVYRFTSKIFNKVDKFNIELATTSYKEAITHAKDQYHEIDSFAQDYLEIYNQSKNVNVK